MRTTLGLALAVLVALSAAAEEKLPPRIELGHFSTAAGEIPMGWEPLEFRGLTRRTQYAVVRDGEISVVQAVSEAAASGLIYPIEVDLGEYPILRWRWRVENVFDKGDVTRREGDDYAARIYVAFKYDPSRLSLGERIAYRAARFVYGDIPGRALNYIWASRAPKNKFYSNPSPFTDFSRLVVCRSGATDPFETWFEEERNLYEDYKRAFGGEPPLVVGIGIMTDSDNTGESAVAYYGDITLLQAARDGP